MATATQLTPTEATALEDPRLIGPQLPHLGFWYGDNFLGEAQYRPWLKDPVQAAKDQIADSLELLEPGPDGFAKRLRLRSYECECRVYRIGG